MSSSGVCSRLKNPPLQIDSFKRTHLGLYNFTELFLSNIMKYSKNKNDIEYKKKIVYKIWVLSDLWDYLRKRRKC